MNYKLICTLAACALVAGSLFSGIGLRLNDATFAGGNSDVSLHADLTVYSQILFDFAQPATYPAQTATVADDTAIINLVPGSALASGTTNGTLAFNSANSSVIADAETAERIDLWEFAAEPFGLEGTATPVGIILWMRIGTPAPWGFSLFSWEDNSHVNTGKILGLKHDDREGLLAYVELRVNGVDNTSHNPIIWSEAPFTYGQLYQVALWVDPDGSGYCYKDGAFDGASAIHLGQSWLSGGRATLLNDRSSIYDARIPQTTLHKFHLLTGMAEVDFRQLVADDFARVSDASTYD